MNLDLYKCERCKKDNTVQEVTLVGSITAKICLKCRRDFDQWILTDDKLFQIHANSAKNECCIRTGKLDQLDMIAYDLVELRKHFVPKLIAWLSLPNTESEDALDPGKH